MEPRGVNVARGLLAAALALVPCAGFAAGPAAKPAFNHLYVGDEAAGKVYRFPLGANGLPALTPDLTLTGGLQAPYGIAFDRSGNMFVSDSRLKVVNVYRNGAGGDAKPMRTLSLGNDIPGFLAVDGSGDLYVDDYTTDAVNMYAPGAKGNASPVHAILNWNPQSIAVGKPLIRGAHQLLVFALLDDVFVYNNPAKQWSQPDAVLAPQGNTELGFGYSMALDAANNDLYVQFFSSTDGPWNRADFAARRLGAPPSQFHERWLESQDCGHGEPSDVVGMAISGDYLVASCNAGGAGLFVYKKDASGKSHAVESLGSGLFAGNWDVELGP